LGLGFARSGPPPGWRSANPKRLTPVAAAVLAGPPVALFGGACRADWLRAGSARGAERAVRRIIVTDRAIPADSDALVFHPPVLALGIGCERGCDAAEIAGLAQDCLADAGLAGAGLAAGAVAAVVSVDLKVDEP